MIRHVLVDQRVAGFFQADRAVLRQGELRPPMVRKAAFAVFVFRLLMIAGDRHAGNHRVEPAAGAEPVAPFGVGLSLVDQVARMDHEASLRGVAVSLAYDAGPHRTEIVLGVAEIDERERLGLVAGRGKVKPFAPVDAVADAIRVFSRGSQILELNGMIVRRAEIAEQRLDAASILLAFLAKAGPASASAISAQPLATSVDVRQVTACVTAGSPVQVSTMRSGMTVGL